MEPGQKVDRYILEARLGEGGMAQVWKARHPDLDKVVAIKCLSSWLASNPEFEQRFLNEGRRQARLRHPNIVPVMDFIAEGDRRYLIMEYVEGESLEALVEKTGGPLPLARTAQIALEIAGALDYAHKQHLVHRDLKPSNILLDCGGRAYLTDFGIAVAVGEQRVTRSGVAVGTVRYMSPEQISRPKEIDYRSDIYSFGCVLYEMLTGRPPFIGPGGGTDFAVMNDHLHRAPEPPKKLNPRVPRSVEQVTLRCLAKSPEERFPDAEALERALRQAFQSATAEKEIANSEGKPRWIYAAAAALILVFVVAAYFFTRPEPAPPVSTAPAQAVPAKVIPASPPPVPAAVKQQPEPVKARKTAPVEPKTAPPKPEAVKPAEPGAEEMRMRACQALGLSVQECLQKSQQDEKRLRACIALGLSEQECAQRLAK